MGKTGFARDLLRPESGDGSSRVTFTELFFDLVFVFAVTQVSHILLDQENLIGIIYTVMLGAAIWWVWVDTAWVTNWLNPETGPVRGMLIALMLLGLLMSSAIPQSFGDKAALFAVSFVALQLTRGIFAILAFVRHRPGHAGNFARITTWHAASAVLWLTGAFIPEAQLWLWLAAILIDYAGPGLRFWLPKFGQSPLRTWDVTGEHMAERVSLFIIIALGESIIVSGSTFSALEVSWSSISAFAAALFGAILLWLLYFSHVERDGSDYISRASERGLVAQVAYTYLPLPMVLGIILTAVADHSVLKEPDVGSTWASGLLCAGAALYLLGNTLFRHATGGSWLHSHLLGVVLLVGLAFLGSALTPLTISWLANAILAAALLIDEISRRKGAKAVGVATLQQ